MTDYLNTSLDITQPEVAAIFDEMSYWAARFARLIFDNIELRRDQTILDIGTGTGTPLFELAHMHGATCTCYGLDVWRQGLDRAAAKRDVYALPNVQIIEGSADNIPLADNSLDLIVGNVILNNLPDLQTSLSECHRVLKRGGRIVMTTNLVGHMRRFYSLYRNILTDFEKPHYLTRLADNEAHRGTREQHLSLLLRSGFRVTRTIDDALTLRFLDGSAMMRHALIRFGFLDGWRHVVETYDEQRVFTALENQLNALADKEGEIRFNVPMLYIEAEAE